jgi:hypothetical protein
VHVWYYDINSGVSGCLPVFQASASILRATGIWNLTELRFSREHGSDFTPAACNPQTGDILVAD